jgi:hypothetical protein
MAKKNKLTKDELELVLDSASKYNEILVQIGGIQITTQDLTMQAAKLRANVEQVKKDLQEKYGSINVDLKDGSYTKSDVEDKKD